jgi:phage tail sheath protein FI
MPVLVSYPGVYIEEVPSGVRTITGVATSIGAFVDFFAQGPMNEATRILSFADFERQFGGLDTRSEASYAIQQFFLNGGGEAYVVRTTSTTSTKAATPAAIAMQDKVGGSTVLTATARSAGAWGNGIRMEVDYATSQPGQFNLTVTRVVTVQGKHRPAQTGTVSKGNPDPTAPVAADTLDVTLGANKFPTKPLGTAQTTLAGLASVLQGLIQAADKSLANATVTVTGSASSTTWLVVKAGTSNPADYLVLGGAIATKLGFDPAQQNVQQYALGGLAVQAQALPGASQMSGSDGTWDPAGDGAGVAGGILGNQAAKTGIWALQDVDLFNILCVPVTANLPDDQAFAVATEAEQICTLRRAMYILDMPQGSTGRDDPDGVMTWLDKNATLRSKNSALYFPRVDIPDPLNGFRLRASPPSGTVAGLWARIDGSRGVWKAPAGTEATLTGVQSLEYKLTDGENGILNPLAINCLRTFPIFGTVCWGARTLNGADQQADEYKYVPVRRLALYIEESLFRGTQWVVFEPNDEPLWSQIRLNVGAFMHNLFRQGAFQGQTPQQAYFVKCDKDTTTQNDIDLGIVNIIVGFAPLKPAEFVVIQIQQIAGDIVT